MKDRNFEDDGRTIADMSGLEHSGAFPSRSHRKRGRPEQKNTDGERVELTKQERRAYTWVALRAAMLIGGVFLAAAALFILFCQFIWFR